MTESPPQVVPGIAVVQCMRCGHTCSAAAVGSACPSCGTPVAISLKGPPRSSRVSAFAVASFVVGLASVPLAVCIPLCAIGFVAIMLYVPARAEVKRGTAGGPSTGLAIAGLVLGIISTLLSFTCLGLFLIGEKYNWNG